MSIFSLFGNDKFIDLYSIVCSSDQFMKLVVTCSTTDITETFVRNSMCKLCDPYVGELINNTTIESIFSDPTLDKEKKISMITTKAVIHYYTKYIKNVDGLDVDFNNLLKLVLKLVSEATKDKDINSWLDIYINVLEFYTPKIVSSCNYLTDSATVGSFIVSLSSYINSVVDYTPVYIRQKRKRDDDDGSRKRQKRS